MNFCCLWELLELKSKKNGHVKYYKLLRFLVNLVLNIPPVVFRLSGYQDKVVI